MASGITRYLVCILPGEKAFCYFLLPFLIFYYRCCIPVADWLFTADFRHALPGTYFKVYQKKNNYASFSPKEFRK